MDTYARPRPSHITTGQHGARVRVSSHAQERAIQRHQCRSRAHAHAHLTEAFRASVLLPRRHASTLRGRDWKKPTKNGVRYRISGWTLLVVRRGLVITTWRLTDEQMAAVLYWTMSGQWHCDRMTRADRVSS